ncbi:MAG: YggS family pyridoxal phosphate-dependent enzyme [Bacteroidota bacterium]
MSNSEICDRLEQVQERIAQACSDAGRSADEITLVAVSKTKPLEDIIEARSCGQIHFGENRAKELQDKMEQLDDPQQEVQWHMIGNLQTNKIKYMVERVNWIHSVKKSKHLREIEKRASRIDRVINVFIQVNISDEDQKSGCDPKDLANILAFAEGLDHVRVYGLMGMATFTDEAEQVRPEFALLRKLRDEHRKYECDNVSLDELSMGMTNDMEVAIQEGATMIRVGRAIFGERNYG